MLLALLTTSFRFFLAAAMFRQKSAPFLQWDLRVNLRFAAKLAVFVLAAFAVLLFAATDTEARRRHYRRREAAYSPPASAMAIDLYTGRVLYSKNIAELRYPASLTKVMTLYLLFDALRDGKLSMNTQLRVSAHAAAQSPTKLDLSEGDTISVADAIGAIVTKSANDMAVAVAEAIAGSEEEFARRMTQKARGIGMLHTVFRNASGLPDSEQQTTAQDLIVLGRSILAAHPDRCKVFATKYFQYDGQVFRNHNTLLFSYEGMEGMKTGFTSASGFNLIATARRNDKRLLAVVLGGSSAGARNATMRTILDHAWPKAMTQTAARKAGVMAAAKLAPAAEPPAHKAAAPPPPPIHKTTAEPAAAGRKPAATAAKHDTTRVASGALGFPGSYSRLKRRPDSASISILLSSIEAGLVSKPKSAPEPSVSEMTTDEPEDKAETAASRSPAYVPPPPQEIVRNETLAAMTAPSQHNVSVHYKTVRQPEVTPLAAAALDAVPEAAPEKSVQTAKAAQPVRTADARVQTRSSLAAATAPEPGDTEHPGPFHVQVGAFANQDQAEERLESVKQALGAATLKAHPEFIMPVSTPAGETKFRARLTRFKNEEQAQDACKRLKKSGIECWGVRAD